MIGIFLEGDIHLFVKDVVDARLSHAKSGDGNFDIEALGVADPIRVEFSQEHAADFTSLVRGLGLSEDV